MSHRLHHFHSPRELTILIIIVWFVEVAIVIGSLLWISHQSDTLSRDSLKAAHSTVETAMSVSNNTFEGDERTQADTTASLDTLQATFDNLELQICPGIDISRFLITSQQGEACREAKLALGALREALSDVRGYASDDRKLAAVFDIKAADETNRAQYERWSAIIAQLETVATSDALTTRTNELLVLTTNHRDAWKAVIDADNAKDAAGFEAATKRVETTLSLLKNVPENSTKTYDELTAAFNDKLGAFYGITNL